MSQTDASHSAWRVGARVAAASAGGLCHLEAPGSSCGAMSQARVRRFVGYAVSWLWYVAAVIWAFSPASPRRIWIMLSILILVMLAGAVALLYLRGCDGAVKE